MEHGGIKKRVFMHYKSLKGNVQWVKDSDCDQSHDYYEPYPGAAHMHRHYELSTPNHVWLFLARTHKMKVREVKDIINEARGK